MRRPRPRPRPRARAGRAPRSCRSRAGRSTPPHEVGGAARRRSRRRARSSCSTRADDAARAEGDSIRQVTRRYADARRRILVANSDGLLAEDDQVRTRFMVNCVAVGDTGMQTGMEAPGRTVGFEYLRRASTPRTSRASPRQRALTMLRRPSRAERQAAGRAQARCRRRALPRGVRARARSRPRRTATRRCSAAGSASRSRRRSSRWSTTARYAREWGTYAIDDEGAPAQRNVLIEDGVLTDYMWDLVRARKEGRASSGNGRRETYQHLPMVRMTNTFLLEGRGRPRRHHPPDPVRALLRRARWRPGEHRDRRLRVRHHRGVHDRERRDHRAGARRAAHRQRARDAASASTRSATTSTPGPARAARTARACRCRPASRRCGSAS